VSRRYFAAAESLRRALKIDPHSIAALNNLGIVLARMGKPAEAIPRYEDALKFHPDDPSTKRNLAIAYFKAQRYFVENDGQEIPLDVRFSREPKKIYQHRSQGRR
jgi:tetratricopeptide (TPR) repeat protein